MDRWAEFEEHHAHFVSMGEMLRRAHRDLTQKTAEIAQEIADTRLCIARFYDEQADQAAGDRAVYLRARARHFDELATRAGQFAEEEHREASSE